MAGRFLMRLALCSLALFSTSAGAARAEESCAPVVGRLVSAEGEVEVRGAADRRWRRAELEESLCERDTVRTGGRSRAAVSLINDAVLRLDQNTTVHLLDIAEEDGERSFLDLVLGAFQSFSRQPKLLAVNTPYLNATIEGTEFVIRVAEEAGGRTKMTVFEGVVAAANKHGDLRVAGGESVVAEAGRAPQPYLAVRPRDAVQWAIYYPPILAALGGQTGRPPADLPAAQAEALELAGRGEIGAALAALDRVPEGGRDARFHLTRASLVLSVGRVDEAQDAIDRALALDPGSGLAHALRAVISVARNERAAALADAERAVELSPEATAPKIALSYAQQANLRLEAARDTLLRATEQQPDDALAWARLAELWLMLGHRDRAREAAGRAVALAPELERAQVVLGFANLTEFRTTAAKEAFGRAIELDSADPLPRLGLGLAQIRESDLAGGRGNIEVAAGLDPNNPLIRSYLGKAYFEERRDPLDAQQLAIAKQLDPLDPTPYLYDAIRKQTENQPVAALEDLQASIELNDNRAVYRGRLLLDQDRAARGASLGRIYGDLGFHELGVTEAGRSLTLDPANAAAHRFLSDTYRGVRRREIARVSELLQAQLLQDININPIQPSISETNLNIVTQGGPAEAGFNEFTPLFERQRAQLNVSGLVGTDDTYGGEGVVSMLYDRYSLSAGAFHFRTDGWRDNHDIEHDIQNVFFQAAITPDLNAQLEVRRRKSEEGDLAFNFDPDSFEPNFERDIDQDIYRAGLRYSPTVNSDFLLSYIYSDAEESQFDAGDTPDGPLEINARTAQDGYQVEGQYLYRRDRFNLTTGGAFNDGERAINASATLGGVVIDEFAREEDVTHPRGYAYLNLNLPDPVLWTVGLSYDDYEQAEINVHKVNPKFGVQWAVTDDLLLRGAVFRVVKPSLSDNRTLEPTQVAGFNQFYDEVNGTDALRYGVGLDWQPLNGLALGLEATRRDLDVPVIAIGAGRQLTFDHEEQTHRAYAYWTPIPEVALTAEFVYDRFEAERSPITIEDEYPEELETYSVPLGARYFHPSGLFASFGATYVNQEVTRSPGQLAGLADGRDDFVVLDAAVGYRLPKRLGVASLQVTNILDEEFRYQDDSFREAQDQPSVGPYFPSRQILARITLNW